MFGITILCNVGALKTDEATPLFLEYVISFTDVCDNTTVYWFAALLTKGTCNSLSRWGQQCIESCGGGLGGCFLSGVVEGVVAIELHLSRASTSVLNILSNSSRLQFPVSNSLLIINLSSWVTLLRRPGTSKLPYCWAPTPKACKPLIWISVLSYICLIPLTSLTELTLAI